MPRRLIALAMCLLSALPLVGCVDDATAPHGPTAPRATRVSQVGAYDVGFTSYVLHDPARADRPIAVYVWYPIQASRITDQTQPAQYPLEPFANSLPVASSLDFEEAGLGAAWQEVPAAAGPFPLVLYSSGWGAPAYASGMFMATEIVRHGFVFAAITHWGDWAAPLPVPGEPYHHLALASYNRPRDVSFTLTDLLARNAASDGLLRGVVDPARIYASGWSLGGYTSTVLAAGDDGVCDLAPGGPAGACGPTPADPRVKAIIPLDGSYQLLHFAELARVRVPALALGEEWANAAAIMPAWQARAHAAFSGSPSYRVDIARTTHMSFANFCEAIVVFSQHGVNNPWPWVPGLNQFLCQGTFMPSGELHRIVNQYVLAFLTHQQSLLTPGFALAAEPDVEFFVTERRSPSAIDEDQPSMFTYFMHQPGRGHGDVLTAAAEKDRPGPAPDAFGMRRLTEAW